MEHSVSSLAFKGSIVEAIAEAKQQKKLFVVYLAGDNSDSKHLETSTWTNPNVSETLTKYCILLHILEGSSEASQFSAIYPQNSTPSITAIGYNGVRLWQTEGFIAAEVLASSLEKAWLSLHVQETTAALLTAALASEKNRTSQNSEAVSSVQENPSPDESSSSSSRNVHIPFLNVEQVNSETTEERNSHEDVNKEADPKHNNEDFLKSTHVKVLDTGELNESTSETEAQNTLIDPHQTGLNNSEKLASLVPGENSDLSDHHLGKINETLQDVANKASEVVPASSSETAEVKKAHAPVLPAIKSNDVFLNIRMPDGTSLQVKYSVKDTLRMVKDYISENRTTSFGSFDLAIPYPRKVFNEQELNSTLSSLGLFNRQALVVVPHKQTNYHYGGGSSSSPTYSSNDGSSNGDAGYWASVKRILSYVNPFSYFGGGASSPTAAQESQSGTWQYSPNPSLRNNLRGAGAPSNDPSSDLNRPPANASGSRQTTSRFGSNIHTLKRDEDDDRFKDRNAFWNGNSTEYGGDNDGK